MTNNEILARWQGPMFGEPPHEYYELPDYLNDPAASMSLLDTLVEKKIIPNSRYNPVSKKWSVDLSDFRGVALGMFGYAHTLPKAIIAACLEVARKEQGE